MKWNPARLMFRRTARTLGGQADRCLGQAEIVAGYQWLLGRTPPTDEIEAAQKYFSGHGNNSQAFQNGLIASEEFRNRRIHVHQHMRGAPVDLFGRKLVFVHIEKCGGTTLRTMLAAHFAEHRICPERFNGLADWTANELAGYDLFAGHFDLASCGVVPGDQNTIVTMLREPKARLLSLFYFWKAHRAAPAFGDRTLVGLARDCTATTFFSHPTVVRHPSIRDAMAGQLTRTVGSTEVIDGFPILPPSDAILAEPDRCLDACWRSLVALAGFGLLEQFEASTRLLNAVLGMRMHTSEPQQVLHTLVSPMLDTVRPVHEPMSERLDTLLDALTPIDRALYGRAERLFADRITALAAGERLPR